MPQDKANEVKVEVQKYEYCKGDHFAHEGPKPLYHQNYLLKDLWIQFILLFYQILRQKKKKKSILNVQAKKNNKTKKVFPKFNNPAHLHPQ